MISIKNEILSAKGKKPIVYDVQYTPSDWPKPIVIFCHGYKGFKDWGAWELVAQRFAKAGFFFIKFNFSHNGGTIENPIDFPDLEAFAQNNFSIELDDLDRVLQFITSENRYSSEIDTENISLIGHSRGGGIVLIKASEDDQIKKVITWAGISDYKIRFQEGTPGFEAWKKSGITHVENTRTKQLLPHYFQFYSNFKENEERLTIKRAVRELSKPHLIVHGTEDTTVPLIEAETIHSWNENSVLRVIEAADHVFNAQHPWESATLPENLKKATDITIDFIK